MQQFCPRCGDEVDQVFGPRGLCKDCFSETTTFVEIPDEIRFEQCSVCKSYKVGHSWNEFESDQKLVFDLLQRYEEDDVEMGASFQRQGATYHVTVFLEKDVEGEVVKMASETVMVPEKTQCPQCARFHGGYYEAIVQLRGKVSEQLLGNLLDQAANVTNEDRNNFISNVEERHGGYDIYVSSNTMAEKLIDILKDHHTVNHKRSKEIVGEKEGKRMYRSIYSVRVK